MPQMMSVAEIKRRFVEISPYIQDVRDWSPVTRYCLRIFVPGVLPQSTEFFNAGKVPAVSNLERANELPYPTIVMGIGVAIYGATLDVETVRDECEFEFEKDQRSQPSIPICSINGGGGLNAAASQTNVAALADIATNGVSNQMFILRQPIAIDIKQSIRAWLRSSGVTALVANTVVVFMLDGIERRRLI